MSVCNVIDLNSIFRYNLQLLESLIYLLGVFDTCDQEKNFLFQLFIHHLSTHVYNKQVNRFVGNKIQTVTQLFDYLSLQLNFGIIIIHFLCNRKDFNIIIPINTMNIRLTRCFLKNCVQRSKTLPYQPMLSAITLRHKLFFCSNTFKLLRPLKQDITTVYIDRDLVKGIIPKSKKSKLIISLYLPSLILFLNNCFVSWNIVTSSAFVVTFLLALSVSNIMSFKQAIKIVAWQVQLTPEGVLKRFYFTVKQSALAVMVAKNQAKAQARFPDQMSWLKAPPQNWKQQGQKWNKNSKLINPLTGQKAYPDPQTEQSLLLETSLRNMLMMRKLESNLTRFPVEINQIKAFRFKNTDIKDIQIPKNAEKVRNLMKSLRQEVIQIDIYCVIKPKRQGRLQNRKIIQFFAQLGLNGDPKFQQLLIALALGLKIEFK